MIEDRAAALTAELVERLKAASVRLVLAESCTAGLAADMIARVPGASTVLWGSFVTYTAEAKQLMLGIAAEKIERYGAVSREIVCDMVQNALRKSGVDLAAAVTGLAGPGGDGTDTPVGTVWIAAASKNTGVEAERCFFSGGRAAIRFAAAAGLIEKVLEYLKQSHGNGS